MGPKSLYISRAVSNFYGTEIKIWAGFGADGNTERKIWTNYEQLLRSVFHVFRAKQARKGFRPLSAMQGFG